MQKSLFSILAGLASFFAFGQQPVVVKEIQSTLPPTTITFESIEYDFGEVDEGDIVTHVYKFTNTGNNPLVITRANGSCGCTVPSYPKIPIMPGESSEIQVNFNSQYRMGKQHKSITIHANTEPGITVLKLFGYVRPAEKENSTETEAERQKRLAELEAIQEKNPNCMAIYPNPTNNELRLDLKENIGQSADVTIRNEVGQTVHKSSIQKISFESTVYNVSDYKPGIYLITIEIEGQKPMTQCFVVTEM